MLIQLYSNNSSDEVLHKDITLIKSVDAEPYSDISIEDPILILSDISKEVLSDVNYVYIPNLKRYYNCEITLASNGIYYAHCNVDPLMSFKDVILNLNVIVNKNEYEVNPYIDDGSYLVEERQKVETLDFPLGFNDHGTHILITAGGV